MHRIYHLHIPRTSGKSVCDALYGTFVDAGLLCKINNIGDNRLMYDKKSFTDIPFVSGHFATNPVVVEDEKFDVFSFVREPISHYMSIASYVCSKSNRVMSSEFMEEFLYGYITPFGANELFSNSGNLQSKMLFCRIGLADSSVVSLRDDDVQSRENIVFIESDMPSEEDIKNKIENMFIFTLDNRHIGIEWLRKKILLDHGLNLDESIKDVSNSSFKNNFTPDISHVREILSRCNIDSMVYHLVRSGESANL